jgi:D-alanyl-D-alanine carboxypeptidase (penicillin-binding protein 5/6)
VFEDLGVDGLKTGYHRGCGIWTGGERSSRQPARHPVVSGLNTKKEREEEPRKLLEWGFKSFKPYRLFDQGEKVSDALVWGGTGTTCRCRQQQHRYHSAVQHERSGHGADRI